MAQIEDLGWSAFPSTHWSLVATAGTGDGTAMRAALAAVLTRYLPPLRCHLIGRRGVPAAEADDVLQSFVTEKILADELIAKARQERGRFRSLLLVALDRFLSNRRRYDGAQKRRSQVNAPLDDDDHLPASPGSPADVFDIAWAREVLGQAVARTREYCRAAGRADLWRVFEARVLLPTLRDEPPVPYGALVDELGFESPTQASNALITANRLFARLLRSIVGEYEPDERAVDEEIADLRRIVSHHGAGSAPQPGIDW